MEIQCGLAGGEKLAALGAFGVGVEDEATARRARGVDTLQEHHADVGHAVGVDRGQRHGIGVVGLVACRFGHPGIEQGERLLGGTEIAGGGAGSGLHGGRHSISWVRLGNQCRARGRL